MLVSLTLILLAGCGGGSGGSGDDFDSLRRTTGVVLTTQVELLAESWNLLSLRSYQAAIEKFNKVLNDNPTEAQRYEAITGIGFSVAKKDSAMASLSYFEQAWQYNNDARAGYAGALISRGTQEDMDKVIKVLESIDVNNPLKFNYTPRKETGVTNADLHAMLAYAYFSRGNLDKATIHIDYAKQQNSENSESVNAIAQIIEDFF